MQDRLIRLPLSNRAGFTMLNGNLQKLSSARNALVSSVFGQKVILTEKCPKVAHVVRILAEIPCNIVAFSLSGVCGNRNDVLLHITVYGFHTSRRRPFNTTMMVLPS